MSDGMSLPADNKLGPYGGVTAVAIAAGISFQEAGDFLRFAIQNRTGRRPSMAWHGTTCVLDRLAVLDHLGVGYREVQLPKRMQLATWCREHARSDRRYMVRTTHHVQIVKGQRVTDQCHMNQPVGTYRWGRKIVTHVIELED